MNFEKPVVSHLFLNSINFRLERTTIADLYYFNNSS